MVVLKKLSTHQTHITQKNYTVYPWRKCRELKACCASKQKYKLAYSNPWILEHTGPAFQKLAHCEIEKTL